MMGRAKTGYEKKVEIVTRYLRTICNNRRIQRNLGVLTSMEKYDLYSAA